MRLARILLAGAAVVVAAWFALAARQAHDVTRATAIVQGLTGQRKLTAAQAAEARSLLSEAGILNPDRTIAVLRARVALLRDQRPLAKRILLGVVADEPDNIDAWYGLATSAADGATITRGLGRIAELEARPHQ